MARCVLNTTECHLRVRPWFHLVNTQKSSHVAGVSDVRCLCGFPTRLYLALLVVRITSDTHNGNCACWCSCDRQHFCSRGTGLNSKPNLRLAASLAVPRPPSAFQDNEFNGRYFISHIFTSHQWRTEVGLGEGGWVWGVQTPRNSEGPSKSCQTQPDCENC